MNLAAFILLVLFNAVVGSTAFIGGQTTAEVSSKYETLVTPAGFTFAIWGVIYGMLGVFVIGQFLKLGRWEVFVDRSGFYLCLALVLT